MNTAARPLHGIRVLDFSQFLAGPYASYLLASLGADAIKIERKSIGDAYRGAGPPFVGDDSVPFYAVNLGKKSISLDLARPEAHRVVKQLVQSADVVIVGGVPTALSKIGLDYETLRGFRNDVVYCAISGYGLHGPKSHLGALDLVIQAASGLISITGSPDSGGYRVGVPITDYGTGMYAAMAVLAALRHRDATGEGTEIDASLLATAVSWGAIPLLHYQVTGEHQPRTGNVHPHIAPYQVFATSDGHLALSAPNNASWSRLIDAIGAPELKQDPRYKTNASRIENLSDLIADLERRFTKRTTDEWVVVLTATGISCGPLQGHDALLFDDEWRDQAGLVTSNTDVDVPLLVPPNRPFKVNGSTSSPYGPPPRLGEHTEELLKSVGFDDRDVAELGEAGVI